MYWMPLSVVQGRHIVKDLVHSFSAAINQDACSIAQSRKSEALSRSAIAHSSDMIHYPLFSVRKMSRMNAAI